jgi:hypothetical protein
MAEPRSLADASRHEIGGPAAKPAFSVVQRVLDEEVEAG